MRAVFYHGGPLDSMSQAQTKQLGESFSRVRIVQCDVDHAACESVGVKPPAWEINGKQHKGLLTLDQLEDIVMPHGK